MGSEKSGPNELKFCEDSRNPKSIRCWKFQLSILKIKKGLFLIKIWGILVIETLKSKISDFLNSNTCFYLRLLYQKILASIENRVSAIFPHLEVMYLEAFLYNFDITSQSRVKPCSTFPPYLESTEGTA